VTDRHVDWTRLNAYVDGELPPQDAADIAVAAEVDAAVAHQIAALHALKADASLALPPAPEDLLGGLPLAPARIGRRMKTAAAVAAVIAVVGVPAILMNAPAPMSQARETDLAASARQLHTSWLAHDETRAAIPTSVVLDRLTEFGRLPVLPDLEATGLSLALVDVVRSADGPLLQIGYRGQHGCHLSLFVAESWSLVAVPVTDGAQERAYAWDAGDLAYLLLANGMDPSRFDLIAAKVEGATRTRTPLDDADRVALAENKRVSAHCSA